MTAPATELPVVGQMTSADHVPSHPEDESHTISFFADVAHTGGGTTWVASHLLEQLAAKGYLPRIPDPERAGCRRVRKGPVALIPKLTGSTDFEIPKDGTHVFYLRFGVTNKGGEDAEAVEAKVEDVDGRSDFVPARLIWTHGSKKSRNIRAGASDLCDLAVIHQGEPTKCILGIANVANNSHVLLPGSHVVRLRISAKGMDPTVASISIVLDGKYSTDAATMLGEHSIMKMGKVKISRKRMIKRAASAVLGSAVLVTAITIAYDHYKTTHPVPAPKAPPIAERAPTPPVAPVPPAPAPTATVLAAPKKHRPAGSKREPPVTYDLRGAHFDAPARIGGSESISIKGDVNAPAQIGGNGNTMK